MLPILTLHHAPEDDLAPVDYTYVPSVSEGRRREQAQQMHRPQGPTAPIVRHRAEPERDGSLPEYSDAMRARSHAAAYSNPYGIPDNPFQPSEESQRPLQPVRRSRAARSAAEQAKPLEQAKPEPDRFDKPASVDIPDWLRVAQQNNMPYSRPDAPRVQQAPRMPEMEQPAAVDALGRPLRNRRNIAQAQQRLAPQNLSDSYAEAGYPQELLNAQRQLEYEAASQPIRRRHGAQYAQRPVYEEPQQRRAAAQSSYPPSRPAAPPAAPPVYQRARMPEPEPYEVEDYEEEDERPSVSLPEWVRRVPWLGITAFVVCLAAIGLWILQSHYLNQTQLVLSERAAQQQAIAEAHPLRYRDLITDKASRYNLHPAFVAAIMLNESSFRPEATAESTGARGLMQLMDETAEWIHGKMNLAAPYIFDSMYDPATNAEFGCWYLNYLSEQFYGDPILVAAAFHAGQGEVRNWLNSSAYSRDGRTIRLEDMIEGRTRQYVTRVLNDYAVYKRLYFGG